jgi:very-short-patch-repair endonuclease
MGRCARSAGIFTAAEAQLRGVDRKALQRSAEKGILIREFRGVYRVGGTSLSATGRALLATIGTGGIASHSTAAELWGFAGFDSDLTHVTVNHGAARVPKGWLRVHWSRRDLQGLVAVRQAVRVTRPLRSVLDMADEAVDDDALEAFVSHCVAERLFTMRRLDEYLMAEKGLPGTQRVRRLGVFGCEVDSQVEAELIRLLFSHGIDRPETQYEIREGDRFLARVDYAWPAWRVALEVDGFKYHSDPQTFVRDRERGNLIVAAGWLLLRTTPWSMRRDPSGLCESVRSAFSRVAAAKEASPEQPGPERCGPRSAAPRSP